MKHKMTVRAILFGAFVLAVSSCFKDMSGTSKYEATFSVHYEPDYNYQVEEFLHEFFNDGQDTVSVDKYLSIGPLTHCSTEADDGSLVGGFAMCIGIDTLVGPDRKPSRFAVFDKGGYGQSLAYAVYHDTLSTLMPEHAVLFAVPNEQSSCTMIQVCVQNVQAVAQAALYGTGLADGPFTDGDYLTLTISGSKNGTSTGSKSVKLVDGRHLLEEWTQMDLTSLGSVDCLDFRLEASRSDMPLYCCIDDLAFHYSEIY